MKWRGREPKNKTKIKYSKTFKLNITDVSRTCPPHKIRAATVFCLWSESRSSLSNGKGRMKINEGGGEKLKADLVKIKKRGHKQTGEVGNLDMDHNQRRNREQARLGTQKGSIITRGGLHRKLPHYNKSSIWQLIETRFARSHLFQSL